MPRKHGVSGEGTDGVAKPNPPGVERGDDGTNHFVSPLVLSRVFEDVPFAVATVLAFALDLWLDSRPNRAQ